MSIRLGVPTNAIGGITRDCYASMLFLSKMLK